MVVPGGTLTWRMGPRALLTLDRPRLLAVLNVTPDSFFDGRHNLEPPAAADHAARLVDEGADALDVGGESTRPGSPRIDAREQIRRVIPVIHAVRALPGAPAAIPISVDTTLAEVARAALDAGADAINDVSAGREDPGVFALARERGAGLILMHRLTDPTRDSYSDRYGREPQYPGVVAEVARFLAQRLRAALDAGIAPECVALDPGLGFGKSVAQNLELIRGTGPLAALGRPIVSGLSRKSFVGRVSLGRDSEPGERLAGTLALSVLHVRAGASILRVHDVGPHAQVLAALRAALTIPGAERS